MHIFTVLPDRFAKDPNADIENLLLWNETIKMLCKLEVCGGNKRLDSTAINQNSIKYRLGGDTQ